MQILPEPVAGVPSSVEVNQMLAVATLNGEWGLFGNAKRAGRERLATDPTRTYLAFLLRRFSDEFWQRTRLDQNLASQRELGVALHLVTRFNDSCWVHPVELVGTRIGREQMGPLLVDLLYEYVQQDAAEHVVAGSRLDVVGLWERLRGLAVGLLEDYREVVPSAVTSPEALIAHALRRAGVEISRAEWAAIETRLRDVRSRHHPVPRPGASG